MDMEPSVETNRAKRTRLSPDARRAQLMEHALAAFAASGIERAVHADVAERAGVSTPTVFKYFPTRESLVDAVLSEIEFQMSSLIETVPEGVDIAMADLARGLALTLSQMCETRPDLMKVNLAWSVAFSPVRERYQAFENELLDRLRLRLRGQSSDRSDARILIGAALLFIRMHFDGSTADVRSRYVDRMAEILDAAPSG